LIYKILLIFRRYLNEKYKTLLESFLEGRREIPGHLAKMIVFIFACGDDKSYTPDNVVKLISRWLASPCVIFTNHPAYVNWIVGMYKRQISPEFQDYTVKTQRDILENVANKNINFSSSFG